MTDKNMTVKLDIEIDEFGSPDKTPERVMRRVIRALGLQFGQDVLRVKLQNDDQWYRWDWKGDDGEHPGYDQPIVPI